ncbi:hypothetical protein ACFYZ5_35490 [Streptomyces chartreusis]|uniref:hypothetical protein n=1 Tax=Streptomyces chartreusis TaxID=1969 RepID=UPI0036D02C0D
MPKRHLIAAVYVKDPVTHEDLILLPGESPDPQIAALVTNHDAWNAPPDDGVEPEAEAVVVDEPDPAAGTAEPDAGQGEAGGGDTRKTQSRRARSAAT